MTIKHVLHLPSYRPSLAKIAQVSYHEAHVLWMIRMDLYLCRVDPQLSKDLKFQPKSVHFYGAK